jgi:Na+/melibiose symporter-like transporter
VLLALTSANFRRLFLLTLLFSGIAGVGGVFDIYMNTYFWGLTPPALRWFALTGFGALIAFATVPLLQARFDKNVLLQICLSIVMVLAITKVTLRFLDVLPANGEPSLLPILVGFSIVSVYLLTICGIMVASLIADLLDEQQLDTGRRQEGVFASALSLSSKATSSIGLIIGGFLLDFVIRLPKVAEPGMVLDDTLFRLAFTDGVAVPLLFFIPIYLISRITMTRERLAEVQAELVQRQGLATRESPANQTDEEKRA